MNFQTGHRTINICADKLRGGWEKEETGAAIGGLDSLLKFAKVRVLAKLATPEKCSAAGDSSELLAALCGDGFRGL